MILVSLVLKLFVSNRPLKLEGVLCIYVLLSHEGQAENHLLCFSIWFEHTFDFHCFIFMIFRLCSFPCYNMVATFLLSRLCLSCPCFKFFDPSTQCLHRWSRLCWCMLGVGRKTNDRKPTPKRPRSKPNRPRPKKPNKNLGRKNFRPKFILLIQALLANGPNTRTDRL
jgi:hypothetical protein